MSVDRQHALLGQFIFGKMSLAGVYYRPRYLAALVCMPLPDFRTVLPAEEYKRRLHAREMEVSRLQAVNERIGGLRLLIFVVAGESFENRRVGQYLSRRGTH